MPAHVHTPVRKFLLLILLFATIAWVALAISDDRSASPEPSPGSTAATDGHAVQPSGSSLEGLNDALLPIIAARHAAEEAERQAAADRAAAAQRATRRPVPAAPAVRSTPTTRCPANIVALIEKHWGRFGPDVVQWAIGIAWRESNCRPDVTSPTGCAGTFQLAVPMHADLFTALGYDWHTAAWQAEPNIIVAANLYASSGPGPWRL